MRFEIKIFPFGAKGDGNMMFGVNFVTWKVDCYGQVAYKGIGLCTIESDLNPKPKR